MSFKDLVAGAHKIEPRLNLQQIVAIGQLVCKIGCPIIDSLMLTRKDQKFTPRTATGLLPSQVAKAYNFPTISPHGRTVAIVELGGSFKVSDIQAYCQAHGYPMPRIDVVDIDGAAESQGDADGEVCLDIQVVLAAAPGVNILVLFAPNTEEGFADAVKEAIVRNVDAISISWGGPEDQWSAEGRAALDAQFREATEHGIGVYCASGDLGSGDGETFGNHIDYPASSPYAVACGGSHLELDASGNRSTETAWSRGLINPDSSGGGESVSYPGRKVPDVSGNGDPDTGYIVIVDGQEQQVGGTSAVAPLYAALQALLNASVNAHVGHLPALFYKADQVAPDTFFDVTQGNNGGYKAGPGYDEVTGLGVVDGQKFLAFLEKAQVSE